MVAAGRGRVTVDFVDHRLDRGTLVWIRPGQVHSWVDITAVDGTLVLFLPHAAPGGSSASDLRVSASWRTDDRWQLVQLAAEHLRKEHDDARLTSTARGNQIVHALLQVLLLRASDEVSTPSEPADAFRAYADAVEMHFAASRQVAWYAWQLGYSQRTLRRATQAATGRTAKQYVDDRVVLEAKRLLVHANVTVAECARRTGFDDVANFSKFFRTRTGVAPGSFAS